MNDQARTRQHISPARLWFGFAGSALSWIALGIIDLLITWQACLGQEQYGGAHLEPGVKVLYLVVTLLLLVTAISAGGDVVPQLARTFPWRESGKRRGTRARRVHGA